MQVLSLEFSSAFYGETPEERRKIIAQANAFLEDFRSELISLRIYRSIRHDSDFLLWLSSFEPEKFGSFLNGLKLSSHGHVNPVHGFFSIYDDSPYLRKNEELSETLKGEPSKFLVAYPMWKSNDWYQLSFDERKSIMAEHIGVAVSHPSNKGVRSYTTYSFGISDSEFVVIYEVKDLSAWSKVTQALREVKARKWITSETPVLVGSLVEKLET